MNAFVAYIALGLYFLDPRPLFSGRYHFPLFSPGHFSPLSIVIGPMLLSQLAEKINISSVHFF